MEERNARGIWVKQKKELSGRFERRWESIITIEERESVYMDWTEMAQDWSRWGALVKMIMNRRVS
jgi:hypothetical protein